MFIDLAVNSITGAPAERNVSGKGYGDRLRVLLRWIEKKSLAVARSINISHLTGQSQQCSCCASKLNARSIR
jgi:hypothetical protein